MRVGLVCPYDLSAPGGVQQLVLELAERLRGVGHEAVVVGAGNRDGPVPEGSVAVGRTWRFAANDSTAPISLDPAVWGRVRRELDDVDVVHVHEPLMPLVGWAGLWTGLPTVATFHADPPSWVPGLYRALPLRGRMRRMVVTAVSPTAAAAIPEAWGPVEIVPNAIDVESYAPTVARVPARIAFLGRDDPRKGLDVLLEAWPMIHAANPDAELMVMGADRGIDLPGVTFLGRVGDEEKRRVLATTTVFVAPNTRGESFGIVVAEAMAAGCAVVASDIPAFRDVAGDTARFVPPGDAPGLAAAVNDLLADPTGSADMGDRARSRSRRFDWSQVAGHYVRAYEVALGMAALGEG